MRLVQQLTPENFVTCMLHKLEYIARVNLKTLTLEYITIIFNFASNFLFFFFYIYMHQVNTMIMHSFGHSYTRGIRVHKKAVHERILTKYTLQKDQITINKVSHFIISKFQAVNK